MRILFKGINYAPESIGIGPYSRGLCGSLVAAGQRVRAVMAKPYYPRRKLAEELSAGGKHHGGEDGVEFVRCPLYLPGQPTGAKRILHHLSVAASALRLVRNAAHEFQLDLDVVMTAGANPAAEGKK